MLGPVLDGHAAASHAYLFHGPGGSGKRGCARELAAMLLSEGSVEPASARARALAGVHPDLSWIVPSGAHEVLVADVDEPLVAAASRTPFEASCRVFVLEGADELGEEAANRMLKTLEEPASYVHIILIAERLQDVLPTIRSRCLMVHFEARPESELVTELEAHGCEHERAIACARLAFGDGNEATALASADGALLRERAQALVRLGLRGEVVTRSPWTALLAAARQRGEEVGTDLEEAMNRALELYPQRERKRAQSDWSDRIKRGRRRAQTAALDQALTLAEAWLLDLAALAWGANDMVRNVDEMSALAADAETAHGHDPRALRAAVELIEDTRSRLSLNVSEELACEALSYRLEEALA